MDPLMENAQRLVVAHGWLAAPRAERAKTARPSCRPSARSSSSAARLSPPSSIGRARAKKSWPTWTAWCNTVSLHAHAGAVVHPRHVRRSAPDSGLSTMRLQLRYRGKSRYRLNAIDQSGPTDCPLLRPKPGRSRTAVPKPQMRIPRAVRRQHDSPPSVPAVARYSTSLRVLK